MKIGLVCPYSVSVSGGVQEVVLALQRHLQTRGHDVRIITARPRDLRGVDTSAMLFVGNAIDVRWPNHTTAPLSSEVNPLLIEELLTAEQFDILHFHEPVVPVLSRQILARSRSVNIATFHANVPETLVNRTLSAAISPYMRSMLKDLHVLTAVSAPAAEFVRTITDRHITLIPNGIELGAFALGRPAPDPTRRTILYVGRLEQRKGLRYLLYAYLLLAREDESLQLVIAGNGPQRHGLEALVDSLDSRVTFLGYVSEDQKATLLARADLFCSPALFGESFGIVLLEAMASGLPTIAGSNAGYRALLRGVGGLSLVNPRDTPEFAHRMRLLLNEPRLRAVWTSWARRYVRQFDYPVVINQYERLYERALTTYGNH